MSDTTKKRLDILDILQKVAVSVLLVIMLSAMDRGKDILETPEKVRENKRAIDVTNTKVDKVCARLDSLIIEQRIERERRRVVDSLIINKLK